MRAFAKRRGVFLGLVVGLLYAVVFTAGCATTNTSKGGASGDAQLSQKKQITHVEMNETDGEAHILVTGDQNLTFTAVKQPTPPVALFYFPDTATALKNPVHTPAGAFITGIGLTELTESGHTVRLEIKTATDAPYTVNRRGNTLDIVFQKGAAGAGENITETQINNDQLKSSTGAGNNSTVAGAVIAPAGSARLLKAIDTKALSGSTQISILSDGVIKKYKSFTLDQPPRIVLDLMHVKASVAGEQKIAVKTPYVKQVRYYSDAQKLRIVFETQKAYLDSYSVVPVNSGLLVTVGALSAADRATVKRIQYQALPDGATRMVVQTSNPVQYQMKRIGPRWLRLFLLNSRMPEGHLAVGGAISARGAISSIVPGHRADESSNAYVDIRLKATVPYLVTQTANKLSVKFEAVPAGTVAEKTAKNTPAKVVAAAAETKEKVKRKNSSHFDSMIREPVYTGEKVALDFFNTDIRNVFRILADISGENFAVDKDVQGQVTLSLNKPVPWDRILDLVLKMNQLEKEKQGGITRIATLKTLRAEKDARIAGKEAAVKEEQARVKYLEAKRRIERLQPLQTVYIQVNYADADADVKPQIEPLISKYFEGNKEVKRGRISIDKRNNVVILTDVPEVIRRAKETVAKIDKLVPQVLIEARIVEASTDFSREIGLSWGMTTGIQANDPRAGIGPQRGFDLFGGTYGWDTAINHPFSSGSPMEIGFNIARIAGGPFGLNARLRALEVNGSGKIISTPKVMTRDNQEAVITQGREYPYFEESESGGTTVKFKKVELKLTVLPNITPDDRVAIKLKIEKKDVITFVANVPVLSTRQAESEFIMNNGDTLVIGGINKTTNRLSGSGFPWLSKIPIFGWLFKTKKKELDKEELLIFITPKILRLDQRKPVIEKLSNPIG